MAREVSAAILHLRYNGRSEELPLAELGLNRQASEAEIKQAVARYLDVACELLAPYVVVRTSQAIIVRPEALYG
ncbi:MAG: hypothetical protein IRZ31_06290 [Thermogemmatispora sp.]|uniref:hypothetical protein n=1 Tax=Thermogemmatispora sp. TaxID=1968838 RepID=UPI00261FDE9D|nr:hypothetical protein [Thermogemmatispora sp.]MBX5456493.1 hypothetical protein [Thermogemmatispora sp.]